jgi:hypothetical protein
MSATPSYIWEEAVSEFLLHKKAHFAAKTHYYYAMQLRVLSRRVSAIGRQDL